MRRLLRWAFNGLAAASLLLCVVTVVLWVRSYRTAWIVIRTQPPTDLQFGVSRGDLWGYWGTDSPAIPASGLLGWRRTTYAGPGDPRKWGYGPTAVPFHFDHFGLGWGSGPYATVPGRSAAVVIIPCWLACLFSLLPPSSWVYRWRRRVRRASSTAKGLCPVCGYDLRATADQCPECGTIPAQKPRPPT